MPDLTSTYMVGGEDENLPAIHGGQIVVTMRGDIELAGFVMTAEEWAAMDATQRAQLLRAALRRDEPWVPSAPPERGDDEHAELVASLA